MGVCIGACAKVDKMAPEIAPKDRQEIEKNLKAQGFDGEDCNLKTAENENFHENE